MRSTPRTRTGFTRLLRNEGDTQCLVHLQTHREQFGLGGTAAILCVADGFVTEVQQYVVMSAELADRIPGNRLW